MAKWTKEKEMYGELINTEKDGDFHKMTVANWNREYAKAFNVYKLVAENLYQTFNWYCPNIKKNPIRPYRVMGQITQDSLLVQRTDTMRWYRMPTKEVAQAFEANLQLEGDI